MTTALIAESSGATPITLIDKEQLVPWLESIASSERAWLASVGFKAEPGQIAFIPGADAKPARVVAAGSIAADPVFALGGLPESLPEGDYRLDAELARVAATNLALGWALGAYAFTRYKAPKRPFARLVWPAQADREAVADLARATFLARDLINTPAEDLGPPELAQTAVRLAEEMGARCTVIAGDALLEQNYPTIHAVGRASSRAPRLVDLRWGDEQAPKVTLVGKGVCFDSGGLDIKPAAGMLEMKKDMGGAAVVLGVASALMAGKTPIRLRVLIPAVENSISGNALRPRDIIRTRSGKTVEIGNTDAEGRLILCDALFEADQEKPELLVDCATLTGAAKIALGPEVQALFCNDDALAEALARSSAATQDPLWRMPLWKPYRKLIDSKIADFNNVASGTFAGAIIGALYLSEFVSEATPWAHLDIMASNPAAKPGRPEGGEATGMRALHHLIRAKYR